MDILALILGVLAQVGPAVEAYEAPFAPLPPVIDGRLDDSAWADAEWSGDFVDIRGAEGGPTPRFRTRMKILWSDTHLFVGARMEEPHLWATLTERDAIIYQDNDFEVFLDPDGDGLAYYELEINALGTEFDLFLDRPYREGGRAVIDWDIEGLRSGVSLWGTLNDPSDLDRRWEVEIAIPWSGLRSPDGTVVETAPVPGDVWRVNFSRVQWPLEVVAGSYVRAVSPTPEQPHPEDNWVWSPQGEINMHIPDRWGRLRFGPPRGGS